MAPHPKLSYWNSGRLRGLSTVVVSTLVLGYWFSLARFTSFMNYINCRLNGIGLSGSQHLNMTNYCNS